MILFVAECLDNIVQMVHLYMIEMDLNRYFSFSKIIDP